MTYETSGWDSLAKDLGAEACAIGCQEANAATRTAILNSISDDYAKLIEPNSGETSLVMDDFSVFIDKPSGDTPDWEHPLQVAARLKAAREAELKPVVLGPENAGYVAPVNPRFIDSRPNPFEGLID